MYNDIWESIDLSNEDKINNIEETILRQLYSGSNRKLKCVFFDNNEIYIYGAGESGSRTLLLMNDYDIPIKGFIDRDKSKHGQILENHRVYSLNEISKEHLIVVSTKYYDEVIEKLEKCNYKNVLIDYANSLFWDENYLINIPLYKNPLYII